MKTAIYTITLLVLAVLVGGWVVYAQTNWYNDSWDYRQKITIDSSQVQSSLTDFPVYVDLATMSSGFFSNVQSDGGDIRVTKADGTTEVAREVVSVDTASSTGELHFKAPSISGTSDTEFYIYYGNSGASNYADSATYGAENVWTNGYGAVWHFNEQSGDVYDSTGNYVGQPQNIVSRNNLSPTGNAYEYNGQNSEIKFTNNNLIQDLDRLTVSTWVKSDNYSGGDSQATLIGRNNSFLQFFEDGTPKPALAIWGARVTAPNTLPTSKWNYFAARLNSNQAENNVFDILINDSIVKDNSPPDEAIYDASEFGIGSSFEDRYFYGLIGEMRLSEVVRSVSWLKTTHTNQNSPTTFYTVGSEETQTNSGKMSSSNYAIVRDSLNSGGLDQANSANYQVRDTVGQPATGPATSTNYTVRAGYRQMAKSSIAVSAPASVTLPAIGGIVGGSTSATADLKVITDSPGGYELKVRATTSPALSSGKDSFADYSAGSSADFDFQIASSESAFGYTPEGTDVADEFLDDGTNCGTGSRDSQSACWRGFGTTDRVIAESTDNNQPNGEITTLRLQAESGGDNIQTSGQYKATIVVTAVAL